MLHSTPSPRRSHVPGTMTLAMRAVQSFDGPRVLRLGVLRDGRRVEERILRRAHSLTVGRGETNTIVVSEPSAPETSVVISSDVDGYTLHIRDGMNGRMAVAQGVLSLDDMVRAGRAVRTPTGWDLPIDERWRGKVSLAGVTLLLQFVVAPPVAPRPQLPSTLKHPWHRRIDGTYNACIAMFVALAIGSMSYVEYLYDPEVEDAVESARTITAVLAPPRTPEPAPTPAPAVVPIDNAQATNTQPTVPTPRDSAHDVAQNGQHRPNPTLEPTSPTDRDSAAALAALRASNAVVRGFANQNDFAAITGVLDTGHSARDQMAGGGLMQNSIHALRDGIATRRGSNDVALNRNRLIASNGPGGDLFGPHHVGDPGVDIHTGTPTTEIIRHVTVVPLPPDPPSSPMCRAQGVSSTIRTNISGIRWCYERSVRQHPGLQGRMELEFTVGASGRATSVNASGFDPETEACVEARVRAFVFPASTEACDYNFPFNFRAGE